MLGTLFRFCINILQISDKGNVKNEFTQQKT